MACSAEQPEAQGQALFVIGGPSLDLLHFAGQSAPSAGGAGMYTSAAACR